MLTYLALTNFQVFRDRTTIPMAELNLLVGPNSAGKSAVLDGWQMLNWALDGKLEAGNKSELLERWRSKLSPGDSVVAIEADMSVDVAKFGLCDYCAAFLSEIDARLKGMSEGGRDAPWFPFRETWRGEVGVVVRIGRVLTTLEISVGGELAISYNHDLLQLYPQAMQGFLAEVAELYGIDGTVPESFMCDVWFGGEGFLHDFVSNDDADGDFNRTLVLIANGLLALVKAGLGFPVVVAGERGHIAAKTQLLSCGSESAPERMLFLSPTSVTMAGDGAADSGLQKLCQSAIDEAGSRLAGVTGLGPTEPNQRRIASAVEALVDEASSSRQAAEPIHSFVNRHLRDSLFLDRGYQIAYEMCPVLPSVEASVAHPSARYWRTGGGIPSPASADGEFHFAALVSPHLIDQQGARHAFSDVGTGISCVVPVLAALHSSQAFIQQPELHLHPALQASLGDVLTDRLVDGDCQHFLETHSEHLLLRLLRRVRETHAGRHQEGSPLALKPHQVSMLYFDPQPDGSTRVKQIRVSRDGDFVDRWPRGFFSERRQELFDE